MTHIGMIGTGGVGGFFGAKLCQLQKQTSDMRVHFLARGEHLRVIRSKGLTLKANGEPGQVVRPFLASNVIADFGSLDVVFICVKEFDLESVLQELRSVTHAMTMMIPLMNGVDIASRVRQVIPDGKLLPACVYIGTHIEQPGVVAQHGGACKILLGPISGGTEVESDEICPLLTKAEIRYEWQANVHKSIWEKFIFIAGYGLVTAAFDKTLGEVLKDPGLNIELELVMTEVYSLANALNIQLDSTIVETSMTKGTQFPPETKTSFQRDFEIREKRDERRLFAGSILELGKRLGVPTPNTQRLNDLLEAKKPVFW